MDIAIQLTARIVYAILSVLLILLFVEAILSWFESTREHPIFRFIKMLTEPAVAPIRFLLQKFDFFRNLPIDFSHLFTMVIVIALRSIVVILI